MSNPSATSARPSARAKGRQPCRPILILALAATLAPLAGCREASSKKTTPAPTPPPVTVATPEPRRLAAWDEFTGRLAAPESVEIRARVSGYLETVHFREGGEVQRGDLLFSIDPRPYRAEVDRTEAELNRLRHRAELTAGEAQRAKALVQTRAISTDDFDERTKTAAEAREAVRAAEASVTTARLDLEFTEIRAPIRGRISTARITPGNLVTGGDAGATLLTTIVSVDPLYCYLEVDERSALRYRELLHAGKRADEQLERLPARMALARDRDFSREGYLDFFDNQLNPNTGTIRARAVFPNPDGLAAPGFFARVRIPGDADYDALLVRDAAIGSDQGRPFVWVVDDNDTVRYRPVTLGPLVDGLRAVRTGLAAADRVVINGVMNAQPGLKVHPESAGMGLASNRLAAATDVRP